MVEIEGALFIGAGVFILLNCRVVGGLMGAAATGLALLYMIKMVKGCVPCNLKYHDEYWRLLTLLGTIGFLATVSGPNHDNWSHRKMRKLEKKAVNIIKQTKSVRHNQQQ